MLSGFRIIGFISVSIFMMMFLMTPVSGKVIDQILAVVDNHLITESDLKIQKRFSLQFPLLNEKDKDPQLQFAIDQVLLLEDAEKFATEKPGEEEITAWLKLIESAAGGENKIHLQLLEEGIDKDGLKERISKSLLSKKFIEQRVNYFIFISENEITSYYHDHVSDWNGSPLESVKSQIYAELFERKRKAKLEEFLVKRRAKSNIRIIPPYRASDSP